MKTVHILWHACGSIEDEKLIGVYESREAAERAKERAQRLPGFVDHPSAFIMDEYEIGKDHWTGGFVRVINEKRESS